MKPITALIILDGFGYREEKEYNAILTDGAVHFMQLWNTCPPTPCWGPAAWTWACPGARWATARWAT